MRLTLRQEWRLRALNSVLGFMDIKTGATIVILFAIVNKVAGIYGLIAIFNGGQLAQLSMYIYSIAALALFTWGMKAVTDEDPRKTLYFAHLFLGDHLLNTIWTVFFAVAWWVYNPHDGKSIAHSEAQKKMMDVGGGGPKMSDEERARAAQIIWNKEKGTAAFVLIAGWLLKIYFAALLYSYAIHLRKGTYRSLPLSDCVNNPSFNPSRSNGHGPYGNSLSTSALAPVSADDYELGMSPVAADGEQSKVGFGGSRFPGLNSSSRGPRDRRLNANTGPLALPPKGGNSKLSLGSTPGSTTARIVRDLEAPIESVLWDEDDEDSGAVAGASGGYAVEDQRTPTDSTSDGDMGDMAPSQKGKTRVS